MAKNIFKKQIVVIHGGETFKTRKEYLAFLENAKIDIERHVSSKRDWKSGLALSLGKKFEVIAPSMPNKTNAQYHEWRIWFQKFIPFFRDRAIFIGHSLGGLFLAKFLSENNFTKKISGMFLIAAPFGAGNFRAPKNFKKFQRQGGKIFLYHSKDDRIVPFLDSKKYQKKLKNATVRVFKDRGHFNKERFPELVKDIQTL